MRRNGDNGRSRLAAVALRCQPDSRLVGLVREGHDPAFEEIVRRYRTPLVTFASGIVADHNAEDVVQEALTRAHSALGRSDAEMNLKPWLFTIVRNGALNSLRNEPVHVHLDENYDGVPQPPEVAARREELAELTASVRELPDQQREALVKRELEGRSHEEIAASLGLSAGAVRGLIYRARATLRDGAGMLIPLPLLRALLSSGSASTEATGAAGAAAAGLAGGGGGVALKAGATLGVAVIAVGSGIAVQHRGGGPAKEPTGAASAPAHSAGARGADGSPGARLADAALPGDRRGGNQGEGSVSSGPGPGGAHGGSSGSSSGPGSGGRSGSGGSSGPGPRSGGSGDGGGHSGSGSGTSSSSGSGSDGGGGGSGDDGGGSTTSGHDGGGSGTSGSGADDGTSGSGGTGDTSGHDGGGTGTSGSGSSGSGGDDGGSSGSGSGDVTTTTGGSSSGSGSSDGGSSGSGSGDSGGTTTTDGGGSGGGD